MRQQNERKLARVVLLCSLGGLCGVAHAGSGQSDVLTQQRQRAYAAFRAQFDRLQLGCGRPFSEGRTRLVVFPVGHSDFFYTQDFGLHMAIKIVGGQPRRLWCLSEAEGQAILRPSDHSGTYWKVAVGQVKKGRQQGTFPNVVGALDGYSAFTQTLETYRLSATGQLRCSRGAVDASGLGVPVITAPCTRE